MIGVDFSTGGSPELIARDSNQVFYRVSATTGMAMRAIVQTQAGYTTSDCTGTLYLRAQDRPPAKFSVEVYMDPGMYIVPANATVLTNQNMYFMGFGPNGPECMPAGTEDVVPLTSVTRPTTPLFAPPATPTAT